MNVLITLLENVLMRSSIVECELNPAARFIAEPSKELS